MCQWHAQSLPHSPDYGENVMRQLAYLNDSHPVGTVAYSNRNRAGLPRLVCRNRCKQNAAQDQTAENRQTTDHDVIFEGMTKATSRCGGPLNEKPQLRRKPGFVRPPAYIRRAN